MPDRETKSQKNARHFRPEGAELNKKSHRRNRRKTSFWAELASLRFPPFLSKFSSTYYVWNILGCFTKHLTWNRTVQLRTV